MTTNTGSTGTPSGGNPVQSTQNASNVAKTGTEVPSNLPDFSSTKHKVKINGAESEVSYKDLVDGYQLNKVALGKMNESAKEMQTAKQIIKMFQENPGKAFKELGVDAKQWASEYLMQDLEESQLSPDEKERRDLKNKLKTYEEQEKAKELEEQRGQMEQAFNVEIKNIENAMMKALNTSGLPKNETTIKMIAQRMLEYHKAGYTDVTVDHVLPEVKQQFQDLLNSFYSNSTDDQLLSLLGEDYTKRVVSAKTKTYKQSQNFKKPTQVVKPAEKVETNKSGEKKTKTPDQWAKEIKEKFNK